MCASAAMTAGPSRLPIAPCGLQGVPLNQGNLAASLSNIIATYELTPQDKSLVVMPLFHVHGLMAGRV